MMTCYGKIAKEKENKLQILYISARDRHVFLVDMGMQRILSRELLNLSGWMIGTQGTKDGYLQGYTFLGYILIYLGGKT